MTGPTSDYESWVLGLRQWREDPSTDLSYLPRLTAESLPPQAYSRLMTHLIDAIGTMMSDFSEKFSRGIGDARSEHEIATVLVGLRTHLARRLQLAHHPSLPHEIQRPLIEAAHRDIRALQDDLEKVLTASSNRNSSDRSTTERMLTLARDNSFTAVLDPAFGRGPASVGSGPAAGRTPTGATPAPVPQPSAVPTGAGGVRRRVFLPGTTPPAP